MDCERALTAWAAGRGVEPEVALHVEGCSRCRAATEDASACEPLLERAVSGAEERADPRSEDRLVSEVVARFGRRRASPRWLVPLSAAALVVVGFLAGRVVPRGDEPAGPGSVSEASAAHERRVLLEMRASLGDDVEWVATVDGSSTVGMGTTREAGRSGADLRVVFLELRDATGRVIARPRLVLPDGVEARLAPEGLPEMRVVARRNAAGPVDVRCSLRFDDGAALSASGTAPGSGASVQLGEVRTHGSPVAVYAAAH